MRTIAYIAPHAASFQAPFLRQELEAVESRGHRVLRFALHVPVITTRRAWNEPEAPLALCPGPPWRDLWLGVRTAWKRRGRGGPALRLLMRDMHAVGWTDDRAWILAGHWLTAMRWAPVLEAERCDHIHAQAMHAPTQVAMYASAMTGIGFTCTALGSDLGRSALLLREKAERARKVLTPTQVNRSTLLSRGLDADRVEVVRHALPPAVLERRTRAHAGNTFHLGASGRLTASGGMVDLIEALALLDRAGYRPVRLFLAGEGPERLRLQARVDHLGLHRQVEFLGRVPASELGRWMQMLDMFVLPGHRHPDEPAEDIPPALMAAMSAGLPVLCTRIWARPELVLDGQTGYLVEPGDVPAMALRISEALEQPARARALGHAARAHLRWEFSRERNLRRLLRHFGDTAAAHSRPVPIEEAA